MMNDSIMKEMFAQAKSVSFPCPELKQRVMQAVMQQDTTMQPYACSWHRRLGIATAFVFFVLVGLGIVSLPARYHRQKAIATLMSAVAAADTVTTFHLRGSWCPGRDSNGIWQGHSWSWEVWQAPEGFRWDYYDQNQKLIISKGHNVAQGLAWCFEPTHQRAVIFTVPRETLTADTKNNLSHWLGFAAAEQIKQSLNMADQVTTRNENKDGIPVSVVSAKTAVDAGKPVAFSIPGEAVVEELYVNLATGKFLGYSQTTGTAGKRILIHDTWLDVQSNIPAATFTLSLPSQIKLWRLTSKNAHPEQSELPWANPVIPSEG
jgi:hypothetical protein